MKKQNQKGRPGVSGFILLICLGAMSCFLIGSWAGLETTTAAPDKVERRVNIPYLGARPPVEFFEPAVFWFGQVTPTINNADVRLWYYDNYIKIVVHIIDRRLWYDRNPSPATMEEWDTVTLLLNQDGNHGSFPAPSAYRFVAQLKWGEDEDYKIAYRGNGSAWAETPIPFTAESEWRGGGPNDNDRDDKGWQATFVIPFASLGLPNKPAKGTKWGLSVVVHDRDDAGGSPVIADQIWPESADSKAPATWGVMNFGIPGYSRPAALPKGSATIRQGLNGVNVLDGHVGGHTTCGQDLDHWTEWGEKNYAGYTQVNIQNQWDISDYPCFSKYFVTFPLDAVPAGKTILDASLSMYMFGNAGGGEWGMPPDSFIQVATIAKDWDEQTLNWNNAPRALENYGGTWVQPGQIAPGPRWYSWDVSRPVAEAYQKGEPLRLALYSADGERHSGKYFRASDGGVPRSPTLQVIWGVPCDAPGVECHFAHLPAIFQ